MKPHRKSNYFFQCARCGQHRNVYLRPNDLPPRFCGRPCSKLGALNPNWKGNRASRHTGNGRAIQLFVLPATCQRCGALKRLDRHHVDGNTLNNDAANVWFLCRRCHMTVDGRLEAFRETARRGAGPKAKAVKRALAGKGTA